MINVMQELFEKALGITPPWFVEKIEFNQDEKRLDIYITSKEVLNSAILMIKTTKSSLI